MSAADDTHAQFNPGQTPTPPPSDPAPQQGPAVAGAPHPPYVSHPGEVPVASSQYGPQAQVPGAVPPAYAAYPPVDHTVKRHSGRAWLWWLLGVVLLLSMCGVMTSIFAAAGSNRSAFSSGGDTIAVIPFDGTIAGTGSSASVVTPESFLKLLERAEDDPNVKAIVLRVNSPGGTVAASEEIATYVQKATTPIVVSVGDQDASGAYMVSSQADKIIAGPGSAVGSIGVIMEVPNAAGLLGKMGISFKVITAGKYKDAGSPFRSLTPTETSMLQTQIDEVYGQFVDIVASGRDIPRSEVESMATGWAWTGTEAKKMHLVDDTGTYKDALKAAAKLGHIEGGYKTDVYSDTQSLSALLSALLGIESQLQAISANTPGSPASAGGTALAR